MADNDKTDIAPAKDGKNPIESAGNKILEAFNKEWQGKIETGMKKVSAAQDVVDKANEALENETDAVHELVSEYEVAKAKIKTLVKTLTAPAK